MKSKHYSGRRSPLPTIGKAFFSLLGILILLGVCLLLFFVITEYRPDEKNRLDVEGASGPQTALVGQDYRLLTFDIGFCGLDDAQDLFLEGGARSGAGSADEVRDNLSAVSDLLTTRVPDFVFLQEVDVNSRRSFGINQAEALRALLPGHTASFALDYKAPYVPAPLYAPTGRVESGLLSLSGIAVRESTRYRFDGEVPFPRRLFDPNDCFMVTRVAAENGGELVLVNARFSATGDEQIRAAQLAQMRAFLTQEAAKGRYVIVGGNWNCLLAEPDSPAAGQDAAPTWATSLPEDFPPLGFHWATDPSTPSRRACDAPYVKGKSFTGVSDGFLLSENIEALSVKTMDLDFKHANHNPVLLSFRLT